MIFIELAVNDIHGFNYNIIIYRNRICSPANVVPERIGHSKTLTFKLAYPSICNIEEHK